MVTDMVAVGTSYQVVFAAGTWFMTITEVLADGWVRAKFTEAASTLPKAYQEGSFNLNQATFISQGFQI